jgi:flagellar biosynthesis protein FlhG
MVRLVPIASGKGGVGKSVLSANLGTALARLGKTVVLVDLDLGGSNLHTCLGLRNRNPGIGSFVWKNEKSLAGLLVETGQERLWLIPGDNLLPGTANLEWNAKRRILRELSRLPADFVILDLGAGSSYNVVDFYLAAPSGLLVVNPEITSVLNAYSFLMRSFPESGSARDEILAFSGSKTEGTGISFIDFARDLAGRYPEKGEGLLAGLESLSPRVVMNRAKSPEDAELGYRLRDISRKNLGLSPSFTGFLLEDEAVRGSIASRSPLVSSDPASPFSRGVLAVASRLASAPEPQSGAVDIAETMGLSIEVGEEDDGPPSPELESLAAEAFGNLAPS